MRKGTAMTSIHRGHRAAGAVLPAFGLFCAVGLIGLWGCGSEVDETLLEPWAEPGAAAEVTAPSVTPVDGRIHGTVRFHGDFDLPGPLVRYDADPFCGAAAEAGRLRDERLLVDADGGLANVLVFLRTTELIRQPRVEGRREMTFSACALQPRVLGMRAGEELHFANDDEEGVLHVVNVLSKRNKRFGSPFQEKLRPFKAKKAEDWVKIRCDVHPWGRAWVGIFDHAYFAVTDASGAFALPEGLPPGEYTLVALHEQLGEIELPVAVEAGTPVDALQLEFPSP